MTPTRSLTRRRACPVDLPHQTTAIIDGKEVQPGQPLKIDGLRGDYQFRYVYTPDGSIAVYGGEGQHRQFRAVAPHRCHVPKQKRRRAPMTEEQRNAAVERMAKARAVRMALLEAGRK
jgi:hypothetical protein